MVTAHSGVECSVFATRSWAAARRGVANGAVCSGTAPFEMCASGQHLAGERIEVALLPSLEGCFVGELLATLLLVAVVPLVAVGLRRPPFE